MAVLIVLWIALVIVAVIAIGSGARSRDPLPHGTARPTNDRPPPAVIQQRGPNHGISTTVQLLFAETQPMGTRIDCIILEQVTFHETPLESGTPLGFDVRLPQAPLVRDSIDHLLREWAEESRVVRLDLRRGRASPQLRIHTGSATVQLDLQSA